MSGRESKQNIPRWFKVFNKINFDHEVVENAFVSVRLMLVFSCARGLDGV